MYVHPECYVNECQFLSEVLLVGRKYIMLVFPIPHETY